MLPGVGMDSSIRFNLPDSVVAAVDTTRRYRTTDEQMEVVLALTRANIDNGGGPFGAAVFDDDGQVVAVGVNRVVADSAPIAHAEILAIAAAGQALRTWDLASVGRFSLVSSTEPCAMCLGAVPWSGVATLVVGARDADARAVGFDEGHKPDDWVEHLEKVGIAVHKDVARDRAADLLHHYRDTGGRVYNGATNPRHDDGPLSAAAPSLADAPGPDEEWR